MLIAQCDSQLVCSEVKLALLESLPPDHEVTVLQRLGLPDERRVHGRARRPRPRCRARSPHLAVRRHRDAAVGPELARLLALTERLRGPGGCPWDAKQTHHRLRRHVLEEAYEVVEAIEELPADAPAGDIPIGAYDALEDELGDLLFQVMIQSVLASEAGAFTVADVARAVHAKLVRRHPHVFGDVLVNDASEVVTNWEQIKKTEKDDQSLVAGVTRGPARADRRAEAVPQGRVDRARTRRRSRRRGPSAVGGRPRRTSRRARRDARRGGRDRARARGRCGVGAGELETAAIADKYRGVLHPQQRLVDRISEAALFAHLVVEP